jgi:hypothetical protein
MPTMPFVEFSQAMFRSAEELQSEPAPFNSKLLDYIVYRPAIYRRNGIRWISVYAWRSRRQTRGLAELKKAKAAPDPSLVTTAATPTARLVAEIFGDRPTDAITCIPCGHSKRADCFAKQIAQVVAELLDIPFVQLFADRPAPGASHPKTCASVPPLQQIAALPPSVIIVDDVATSGWHIEDAMVRLRGLGVKASAVAWISGASDGEPSLGLGRRLGNGRRDSNPAYSASSVQPAGRLSW